jgi:hypothetical protein
MLHAPGIVLRQGDFLMPKRKTPKVGSRGAQAKRERELHELIEQVEAKKGGIVLPEKESPHDFVERKMRNKLKPDDVK